MKESSSATATAPAKTNGKSKEPVTNLKVVPEKTPAGLSIDEKIRKVADLNDLISKRNRFLDARMKLNSFNLKREESTTRILIQDNDNNQFVTSHTESIEKIMEVVSASIEKGLAEVEAKITF